MNLRTRAAPGNSPGGGLAAPESKPGRGRRRFLVEFLLVVFGLLLFSAAVVLFDLDRRVSDPFHNAARNPAWWGKGRAVWDTLYRYGTWPANLAAIVAAIILLLSFVRVGFRVYRRGCLLLVLVLLVGPGLLVNAVLKEGTGRPRPRDLIEFGGSEVFHPLGQIDLSGDGEAFPSGHASMGFYFTCFYLILRRTRRSTAFAALAGGLVAGGILGFQRIAVGAHFLSDVVWSGGLVYLVALALDALLGTLRWATPEHLHPPTR